MKRSAVGIADVADWHNLTAAFWQASRGKASRADVAAFRTDLDRELAQLPDVSAKIAPTEDAAEPTESPTADTAGAKR